MTKLRWIRGAARQPRYVGCGSAWPLYRWIDDLQGRRALLERAALRTVGRFVRLPPVCDTTIQDAWRRLNAAFPDITAALLIHTGFYKDTIVSGVLARQHPVFVKVFPGSTDHEAEQRKLDALRDVIPQAAALPSVEYAGDGVIAYTLLHRSRRRMPSALLEDVALDLGLSAYRRATSAGVDAEAGWDERVAATCELLSAFGAPVSDDAATRLRTVAPLPTIAHGDFTPWNAFLSEDDRLAIVDYERVGLRAPFTDAWHLATQPRVLLGQPTVPSGMLARVHHTADCDVSTALGWYCAYLIQELHQDASDWVLHDRHHPQLRRLIVAKLKLLEEASSMADGA